MSKVLELKLSDIREPQNILTRIEKEGEDYLGLVDSIRQAGILNPFSVREASENGKMVYEVIDGNKRFNAAKDAGLEVVNVQLLDLNEQEMLVAQIIGNVQRVVTQKPEYAKQLAKIFKIQPTLTVDDVGALISKSGLWVSNTLSLNKLNENIQKIVDEGKITATNAVALAKVPSEEQDNFLERAQTESHDVFLPLVAERVQQISKANRAGKDASEEKFTPNPHLRRMSELKEEYETGRIGKETIERFKTKKSVDGWKLAIEWVLHLNLDSVEEQKTKWTQQKEKNESSKEERAKEKAMRDLKKLEEKKKELQEAVK